MTQICRSCGCTNFSACPGGCTNFSACPGGCWWVEDDLCSSCAAAVDVATGQSQTSEELSRWSLSSGGVIVPTEYAEWTNSELAEAWGK